MKNKKKKILFIGTAILGTALSIFLLTYFLIPKNESQKFEGDNKINLVDPNKIPKKDIQPEIEKKEISDTEIEIKPVEEIPVVEKTKTTTAKQKVLGQGKVIYEDDLDINQLLELSKTLKRDEIDFDFRWDNLAEKLNPSDLLHESQNSLDKYVKVIPLTKNATKFNFKVQNNNTTFGQNSTMDSFYLNINVLVFPKDDDLRYLTTLTNIDLLFSKAYRTKELVKNNSIFTLDSEDGASVIDPLILNFNRILVAYGTKIEANSSTAISVPNHVFLTGNIQKNSNKKLENETKVEVQEKQKPEIAVQKTETPSPSNIEKQVFSFSQDLGKNWNFAKSLVFLAPENSAIKTDKGVMFFGKENVQNFSFISSLVKNKSSTKYTNLSDDGLWRINKKGDGDNVYVLIWQKDISSQNPQDDFYRIYKRKNGQKLTEDNVKKILQASESVDSILNDKYEPTNDWVKIDIEDGFFAAQILENKTKLDQNTIKEFDSNTNKSLFDEEASYSIFNGQLIFSFLGSISDKKMNWNLNSKYPLNYYFAEKDATNSTLKLTEEDQKKLIDFKFQKGFVSQENQYILTYQKDKENKVIFSDDRGFSWKQNQQLNSQNSDLAIISNYQDNQLVSLVPAEQKKETKPENSFENLSLQTSTDFSGKETSQNLTFDKKTVKLKNSNVKINPYVIPGFTSFYLGDPVEPEKLKIYYLFSAPTTSDSKNGQVFLINSDFTEITKIADLEAKSDSTFLSNRFFGKSSIEILTLENDDETENTTITFAVAYETYQDPIKKEIKVDVFRSKIPWEKSQQITTEEITK